MKNKYDLSIGMIVKNEEKYLEQCLKALLPLKEKISCEIIITDTGSTDKTIEIAEKYADKVLHFEWCDDFSAARNTGVEACSGDWFMYIDADEIFEDTVVEIAEFMQSKDRDNYDCASYTIKNILDDDGNSNTFEANRIHSFIKGKRFFSGKIHESFSGSISSYQLKLVTNHYGYLGEILKTKKGRNRAILEEEYEKSPNDLRIIRHLMDVVDDSKIEELAIKTFDLYDANIDSNLEGLQSQEFLLSIYCRLNHMYLISNKYDDIIKTCERYFNSKVLDDLNTKINVPTLDMHHYYAKALQNIKKYQEAIEEYRKYIKMFNDLIKKPDTKFSTLGIYSFNNEKSSASAEMSIINCYFNLEENENALRLLESSSCFEYAKDDNSILNLYILKSIEFDRVDLYNKVLNYYNENNIEYNYKTYEVMIIADLYFSKDISYFKNNYYIGEINNILLRIYTHVPKLKEIFYDMLICELEVDSLKELKIYLQLAYYYLNSNIKNLKNEELDDIEKQKIENIFNFYVETMNYYLKELYQPVMLQSQNLDLLLKEEAMCILIGNSFENRGTDRVLYIKALKDALKYNENFKYIILNSIDIIQKDIVPEAEENENNENNEFDDLAVKIKQSISSLILSKQLEQAKQVLEQYKQINPTDPDIEKFIKLMI